MMFADEKEPKFDNEKDMSCNCKKFVYFAELKLIVKFLKNI